MVLFFSKELAKLPKCPTKKLKNALKFKNKFRESKNRKIEKYQFCRACYFNLLSASRAEYVKKIISHDQFLSTLRYKHQVLEQTF